MKNIEVSVCVSVHNTAKYLPRCLDSLLAQTVQNLEIVLVNNGSTDNSEDIMHQYADAHPDISWKIIPQEDKGLAQGRQTGIVNATGKYIAFLDADDLVAPTMSEEMLHCACIHNVDIVEVDTIRDGVILSSPYEGVQDAHGVLRDYFRKGGIQPMLWLRLYKRSLFKKNVMPDLYTNNEDVFGLPCLLHAAETIYFLHKPLHTYSTDNEGAVMKTTTTDPKLKQKLYSNVLKSFHRFQHFEDFVGPNLSIYEDVYNTFKASNLYAFILNKKYIGSYKQKIADVIKVSGLHSEKELRQFTNRHFVKSGFIGFLYKLFGFSLTLYIYNAIKR